MDKRIIKTKRNIKETFTKMLQNTAFDKITVTELCERGCVGRITFYTYYDDKYALVDEIMDDYMKEALDDYHNLQKENNPRTLPLEGYLNMLTAILNLYFNHFDFSRTRRSKRIRISTPLFITECLKMPALTRSGITRA